MKISESVIAQRDEGLELSGIKELKASKMLALGSTSRAELVNPAPI